MRGGKSKLRNRYSKKRKWNMIRRLFTVLGGLPMEPGSVRGRYRHHPFLPVCMADITNRSQYFSRK